MLVKEVKEGHGEVLRNEDLKDHLQRREDKEGTKVE
jgi:hypothetical protein